jgi:hypothetical protein
MYFTIVIACFIVLPIISIVIESIVRRRRATAPDLLAIALRWFTFWIVGVRLFTAGVSQAIQPQFTAETIFGTDDPQVLPFISELGYANIAMGTVGILSVFIRSWTPPAAVVGAVFLGLDGIRHVVEGGAFTPERTLATVTDLLALVVLGGGVIALAVRDRKAKLPGR